MPFFLTRIIPVSTGLLRQLTLNFNIPQHDYPSLLNRTKKELLHKQMSPADTELLSTQYKSLSPAKKTPTALPAKQHFISTDSGTETDTRAARLRLKVGVEHFVIFAITSKISRIPTEHINLICSLESRLFFGPICSIRILRILRVIIKILKSSLCCT